MSQAGPIDVIGGNPSIPTEFVTDNGTAVPIANVLEILGTSVIAGSIPVETTGSGNTVTIEVQTSQAIVGTDATKIGLAAFDSSAFSVDANGFVTLNGGGGATTNIDVDAFTPPGTDPVVPNAGNIIMTGAQVATGTIGTNVIRTNSLAANTVTIEIQRSTAVAATDITKNGVSHFNSTQFTVDANGFVELAGAGLAIDSIGTQTGTNPIVPTAGGLVTINGAVVAAGTNPVRSDGTGANTMAIEVQISQALAATDATKIGLSNFNSAQFTVDANGFVSTSGTGIPNTITGDSGGALSPTAGNWNLLGSGSITTSGSGSTLTTQLTNLTNHNVLLGAGTATITNLAPSATSGVPLISQGAAADPAFGTAVVEGGGTGNTTFTAYSVITAGTTATGAFQNVSGLGTSGQVLTSAGAGALPTWTTLSGGGITNVVIQNFVASGTYTPTAGMTHCIVELWGAGGGGGGCAATGAATVAASGGGGGAAYSIQVFDSATIGASQSVTLGAAGAAGAAGNNAGGAGGASIFGALLTANGGSGGAGSAAAASVANAGGTAGSGSSGALYTLTGGSGGSGFGFTSGIVVGGMGGNGPFCGSFTSTAILSTGTNSSKSAGLRFGGGGTGVALGNNQAAISGSQGHIGAMIVTEFIV